MDYAIKILYLAAGEAAALAEEHGCFDIAEAFGPGIYVVFDCDMLPRGPFTSVGDAAQSLVDTFGPLAETVLDDSQLVTGK